MTGGDKLILHWSVNYVDPSSSDVSQHFSETSPPGYDQLLENNVGYTFRFTLISASPGLQLTSTATTTISGPQLNGTQVQCRSSSSASTSVIQVITGEFDYYAKTKSISCSTVMLFFSWPVHRPSLHQQFSSD